MTSKNLKTDAPAGGAIARLGNGPNPASNLDVAGLLGVHRVAPFFVRLLYHDSNSSLQEVKSNLQDFFELFFGYNISPWNSQPYDLEVK